VASLEEFLRPGSGDLDQDGAEGDCGYDYDESASAAAKDWAVEEDREKVLADDGGDGDEHKGGKSKEKKKKKVVADSWEDEETSVSDAEVEAGRRWGIGCQESSEDEGGVGPEQGQDQSLVKVYEALKRVKTEFDEKFLKIWS